MTSRHRKRKSKAAVCVYCQGEDNDCLLGEMQHQQEITVHLNCLYTSSMLKQGGKDNEGIYGFLISDIKKNLKDCRTQICVVCSKNYASIQCEYGSCNKLFHLKCLLSSQGTVIYNDTFPCRCAKHSQYQRIPVYITRQHQLCVICQDNVDFKKSKCDVIWATCCRKRCLLHKKCIQAYATSAGYFLRCPLCNDSVDFAKCLEKYGIFIHHRDALWENCNYYTEQTTVNCSAEGCQYKDHPLNFANNVQCRLCLNATLREQQWDVIACSRCYSFPVHRRCAKLSKKKYFFCPSCLENLP